METDFVEKHHLVFYIVTIISIFLLEFFIETINVMKSSFEGMVLYIFLLIFFTNALLFVLYGTIVMEFLGFNYKPKNPIKYIDFLLTTPAIITTFLINDIYSLLESFLATIILIPFVYFGIYLVNLFIFPRMFN